MFDNVRNHRTLCADPKVQWQPAAQLGPGLEAPIADYLLNSGSLTQRLIEVSGGRFAVTPLYEREAPLLDSESTALHLPPGSRGWVREVYLTGQGAPWVFARTVIPEAVQRSTGLDFRALGDQPIGPWLFGELDFRRGAIELCRYEDSVRHGQLAASPLWARRSCFERGELAILVLEVFLPTFWASLEISGNAALEKRRA
ncbi:chorismate lyase [Pseudomonas gingeri]|uniref:chorismate--pyruvate lyase family protein n=1 Tax=Pseudomonas gingeri TaxID=117681 RepID=UPI0015A371B0|nr:chorismate lyase [Pseudomonas gingeri]NWA26536.1 chorismate lyase [Pseudomonas gingeri]NWD74096.1 chorismate lyase [Pseudomonas gingeri]